SLCPYPCPSVRPSLPLAVSLSRSDSLSPVPLNAAPPARASAIRVVDISGGCGAMYEVHIESEEFREKRTVQQHQMVNQALSEEIKHMHGLRIFTSTPKP
ncbi:PREDICTED: bolA-like protein 3, partial [Acanthisitta chloris]|uniref:bolA-like protein 3 n=1 Tax=Acanthisitta chloris TaxID=57068 RepID=UPI0004F0D0C9